MNWFYSEAGKQAGPVTDEQLAELVRVGRITDDTLVWHEGLTGWVQYRTFRPAPQAIPGMASEPAPPHIPAAFPTGPSAGTPSAFVSEEQVLATEYKVELGEAFSRSWAIFTGNAGIIIGTFIIFCLILGAASVVSAIIDKIIPLASIILSLFYTLPLLAGLQWFFLRLANKDDASVGDVFAGFSRNYLQLVLLALVQWVYTLVCSLPILATLIFSGLLSALIHHTSPPGDMAMSLILGMVVGGFITICALVYLSTVFVFSILLIVDKGYSFWPAMRLSAKKVSQGWWATFLFLIVIGLLNLAGILLCCVGSLVTVPLGWTMLAVLYNDNFSALEPQEEL